MHAHGAATLSGRASDPRAGTCLDHHPDAGWARDAPPLPCGRRADESPRLRGPHRRQRQPRGGDARVPRSTPPHGRARSRARSTSRVSTISPWPARRGRYLLFLNDDTEPCGPDWLRALEEHAQRPEVGAVGAKLLYPDGRIQHAGIAVGIGGLAGHPFRFRREAPDEIRDVSAVTAACLMMRREVFDAVGGFDERLPVNSNDVDLCLRLARARLLVDLHSARDALPPRVADPRCASAAGRRLADDPALAGRSARRPLLQSQPRSRARKPAIRISRSRTVIVSLYEGIAARSGRPPDRRRRQCRAALLCAGRGPHGDRAAGARHGSGPRACAPPGDPRGSGSRRRCCGRSSVPSSGRSDDERWFCFEPIADSARSVLVLPHRRRAGSTSHAGAPCGRERRHGSVLRRRCAVARDASSSRSSRVLPIARAMTP